MKNVDDIYPLTPMQQGMLFHSLYAPAGGLYLEQKTCKLRGDLDVNAFTAAWQRVLQRHTALRTAFLWKGLDEPVQVVRRTTPLACHQEDWRDVPQREQQPRLELFLRADRMRDIDLSRAPLMRIALFRTSERVHQLVWTHHHIVLDGWSLPLIFRDVLSFYDALRQGREAELPSVRPYRDYIASLSQRDMAASEKFWREELAGIDRPTLVSPEQPHPRSSHPEAVHGERHEQISQEETEQLQSLARAHGLTLNTLVQAAWGLLLSHDQGRSDVIFGATVSGRPTDLPGAESIVGMFINTLPVRVRVGPQELLLDWLARLQARQSDARQFEYTPLTRIQSWSSISHAGPLFDTLVVYENYPVSPSLSAPESTLMVDDSNNFTRLNYPLVIKAWLGQKLSIGALYDPSRFRDASITRIISRLKSIVLLMTLRQNARLTEIHAMLADADRRERMVTKRIRREVNLERFRKSTPKTVALSDEDLVKRSQLTPDQTYPLVMEPAIDEVDLVDWARANVPRIESELARYGAILFRGFDVDSVETFEGFASAIRPKLFEEYGDLPRENGKVYKSTPYREDRPILFHNESSQMHRWPMKQWFCCIKKADEGGETPIVDCREVYRRLDPKIVEAFRAKQLMYVRSFIEGLDVSWQDFFGTSNKQDVERYCRQNHIQLRWTTNNVLRTSQISPGVAKHPTTGEMVFFNQVQLHHASCLDERLRESVRSMYGPDEMPRNVLYGDGSPIADEVIREILDVYWNTSVSFSWQEGDILMVDNMLTAHARNPFKGSRKIVVALAEIIRREQLAA